MRVVILTEVKKKKYLKEILLLKKFLQSQNYLSSITLQNLYLKEVYSVLKENINVYEYFNVSILTQGKLFFD